MAADLAELKERVLFARAETEVLTGEVMRFLRTSVKISAKPTPGRNTKDFYATQTDALPVGIRSRAGTIANELRSVLDGLACTLAGRNGQRTDDSYFPISKSEAIFDDDGRRKMRRLSEADKAKIADLKPYRGGHPHLFPLHEADRTRKHQRLAAGAAQQLGGSFGNFVGFGGGMVTIKNCNFNNIYVEHLVYRGGATFGPAQPGTKLILEGVPDGLPFRLDFAVAYQEPEDLNGRDILESLVIWCETAADVIRLFD